jgi:K+-transporting ATPase ATPase C chain
MKNLFAEFKTAVVVTLILSVVCCGLYPALVYGVSQLLFRHQANGSLIEKDGNTIGSELIGQSFTQDKYFHPRPSAAGTGYDAQNSSGTNLGPTSQKLIDSVKAAAEQYRKENNLPAEMLIPADAVTSSGSGLDPHISVKNAQLQALRVAKARNVDVKTVLAAVEKATDGRQLGFLGEPGVNVLKVNLMLDGVISK